MLPHLLCNLVTASTKADHSQLTPAFPRSYLNIPPANAIRLCQNGAFFPWED
jgi:hypothetical protein